MNKSHYIHERKILVWFKQLKIHDLDYLKLIDEVIRIIDDKNPRQKYLQPRHESIIRQAQAYYISYLEMIVNGIIKGEVLK